MANMGIFDDGVSQPLGLLFIVFQWLAYKAFKLKDLGGIASFYVPFLFALPIAFVVDNIDSQAGYSVGNRLAMGCIPVAFHFVCMYLTARYIDLGPFDKKNKGFDRARTGRDSHEKY
jgi:hypothetical protein